jgi:hypothetical protein
MFKFLITIAILIFVFGRLIKFLLKYAIIGFAQKQNYQSQTYRKEGDIKVDSFNKKAKKNSSKNDGDYIDYEIVK